MMKLKQLDPDAKCSKCGHDKVGMFHEEAGWDHEEGGLPERITRVCERCHYQWCEKPLNVKQDLDLRAVYGYEAGQKDRETEIDALRAERDDWERAARIMAGKVDMCKCIPDADYYYEIAVLQRKAGKSDE